MAFRARVVISCIIADDFTLLSDVIVRSVTWYGNYSQDEPELGTYTDFSIRLFNDGADDGAYGAAVRSAGSQDASPLAAAVARVVGRRSGDSDDPWARLAGVLRDEVRTRREHHHLRRHAPI